MTAILTKLAHILRRSTPLSALTLIVLILTPQSLLAQGRVFWQPSGVVLCDTSWTGGGEALAAVPDGHGGAVVVWPDRRGNLGSAYAQRVDSDGRVLWPANGVLLKDHAYTAWQFRAVPDGQNGLIAIWIEYACAPNAVQVTAQRVDSAGNVKWGPNGVVLAGSGPTNDYRYYVEAASDGHGGVVVASLRVVYYFPDSAFDSVCVQRLDSLGQPVWPQGTVTVWADTNPSTLYTPALCVAEEGFVYVGGDVDQGGRNTAHVQRLDSAGMLMWPGLGVSPCSSAISSSVADLLEMGAECMVVFGRGLEVKAQRLGAAGHRLWGPDGRCVFPAAVGFIYDVEAHLADAGATNWVCEARRSDTMDVLAQRLDENGNRVWDSLGVYVGTLGASEGQGLSACMDNEGGLIVAWPAMRRGMWDVYAQHLDRNGTLLWSDTGLVVVSGPRNEFWEPCVVPDSMGGAIVAWGYSTAGLAGVNAQRIGDVVGVNHGSQLGTRRPSLRIWPVPARDRLSIAGSRSLGSGLDIVDVLGRTVRRLSPCGTDGEILLYSWDLRDEASRPVPEGVYCCRVGDGATATVARAVVLR